MELLILDYEAFGQSSVIENDFFPMEELISSAVDEERFGSRRDSEINTNAVLESELLHKRGARMLHAPCPDATRTDGKKFF